MNTIQERRRAALVRQHASLADQRDAAIAKLCRVAAKLAAVQRQLGRYEKLIAQRSPTGTLPSSWHDIEQPPAHATGSIPPDGDDIPEHLLAVAPRGAKAAKHKDGDPLIAMLKGGAA